MALEIPALGRPFSLGMLYDDREEKIIPGITLWNKEDLVRNISRQTQNNTDFEVLTSDSFSDKSSAMDISGTLKLSVMSGMVNVGGSGKYLTDTKESKKQARVTLNYKRTTRFEQLYINQFSSGNITNPEVFNKGIATHVVTGILYGAWAFFIFDQKVNNSEETRNIQGKLKGMVMKIGELKGKVLMNDTEKEVVRQFSCKFHGDFALERNPTTYEEAVEIYASLPILIGVDGEKAVPIKVWLHPLNDLDSRAARLGREISEYLVSTAGKIIQQMSEVIMECNDMMGHPAARTFPALANKISQFKNIFVCFRIMFQKKISQVLPSVRSGSKEESILGEVLASKEKSPFSDQKIRTFLGRWSREMVYVHSLFTQLEGFKIVTEESELINEILDPEYKYTWCFNFSLVNKDLYLSHLESWLSKEPWNFQEDFSDGEAKEWFEEKGISDHAKHLLYNCHAVVMNTRGVKCLVTSVECRRGPGINIHQYSNGDFVTNFCTCDI